MVGNLAWKEEPAEMPLPSCLFCWNRSSHSCFWKAVGEARPQIWLPLADMTRGVHVGLVCLKLGYLKWAFTHVSRVHFEVFRFFYGRVYTRKASIQLSETTNLRRERELSVFLREKNEG